MKKLKLTVALGFVITATFASAAAEAVPVGLELALLSDVSTSVSATEFNLQRAGYASAFNNASVQTAIQAIGGIAVTYIQWSGDTQQQQSVGWTWINNAASASAFATSINNASRAFSGGTSPAPALNFTMPLFSNNGFEGQRLVIDISSDGGGQTTGAATAAARNAALGAGVTSINALVISDLASTSTFFANSVIGGKDAFLIQTDDFSGFHDAFSEKLNREISAGRVISSSAQVPISGTASLLGLGLLAFGVTIRRQRS